MIIWIYFFFVSGAIKLCHGGSKCDILKTHIRHSISDRMIGISYQNFIIFIWWWRLLFIDINDVWKLSKPKIIWFSNSQHFILMACFFSFNDDDDDGKDCYWIVWLINNYQIKWIKCTLDWISDVEILFLFFKRKKHYSFIQDQW